MSKPTTGAKAPIRITESCNFYQVAFDEELGTNPRIFSVNIGTKCIDALGEISVLLKTALTLLYNTTDSLSEEAHAAKTLVEMSQAVIESIVFSLAEQGGDHE